VPQRDPVLKLLLIWVTLLTTVLWLPAVRALMHGETYQWLAGPLTGEGMGGDYWKLLIALGVVLVLQASGRRGPRPLFPILLLPLLLALAVAAIRFGWLARDDDNFGILAPMDNILPVLSIFFLLLAVWWTKRVWSAHRFLHSDPPWVTRNWILLGVAAAIVPLQYVCFAIIGGMGNDIGVILTVLQWFVLNAGLTAPSARPEPPATPEPFPPP
jgi:hypothetical protein